MLNSQKIFKITVDVGFKKVKFSPAQIADFLNKEPDHLRYYQTTLVKMLTELTSKSNDLLLIKDAADTVEALHELIEYYAEPGEVEFILN